MMAVALMGAFLGGWWLAGPIIGAEMEVVMGQSEEFLAAVTGGDAPRVKALVEASPSLAAARNEKGVSAPLLALYYMKNDLADFLVSRKEAVEPLDVFEAAAFGRTERLKTLLDQQPSLADAYAEDGFFPLGLAAFYRQEGAVSLLLERRANPNLVARNTMKVGAIHAAAASRSLPIARALIDAGADVNRAQQAGFTPLHEAAAAGQLELARLLLDRGADPSARNDDGRNALDLAREAKHQAVIDLLTSRGARD
jgi:ankyrin repeat protein